MDLRFREKELELQVSDGRRFIVPLKFYPTLAKASPAQRRRWKMTPYGTGFEWPEFDLLLSTIGFMEGRREHVPPPGWRERMAARRTKWPMSRASKGG